MYVYACVCSCVCIHAYLNTNIGACKCGDGGYSKLHWVEQTVWLISHGRSAHDCAVIRSYAQGCIQKLQPTVASLWIRWQKEMTCNFSSLVYSRWLLDQNLFRVTHEHTKKKSRIHNHPRRIFTANFGNVQQESPVWTIQKSVVGEEMW